VSFTTKPTHIPHSHAKTPSGSSALPLNGNNTLFHTFPRPYRSFSKAFKEDNIHLFHDSPLLQRGHLLRVPPQTLREKGPSRPQGQTQGLLGLLQPRFDVGRAPARRRRQRRRAAPEVPPCEGLQGPRRP